ncbi:MAG: TRAP transporter substrate-binding protein DctP [candidate division WOR-3 bacterium]
MKKKQCVRIMLRWFGNAMMVLLPLLGNVGEHTPAFADVVTSKPMELRVSLSTPPMAPPAYAVTTWAKEVERRSGGIVKFTIFYASSLFPVNETLQAVKAGIADLSDCWHVEGTRVFPFAAILNMPGLDWPGDPFKATLILRELIRRFPMFTEQYQGLRVLYPVMFGESMSYLHAVRKPVKNLKDLKGFRMWAGGEIGQKLWARFGVIPISLPYEDLFMALERGLIDGHEGTWGWMEGAGVLQLTPYHTELGTVLRLTYQPLVMNPKTWERLPSAVKDIIYELDEFYTNVRIKAELDKQTYYQKKAREEWGHTFIRLPQTEIEKLLREAKLFHKERIEEIEKFGVPLRIFYTTLCELIKSYK